jgi:hypothetical protein
MSPGGLLSAGTGTWLPDGPLLAAGAEVPVTGTAGVAAAGAADGPADPQAVRSASPVRAATPVRVATPARVAPRPGYRRALREVRIGMRTVIAACR